MEEEEEGGDSPTDTGEDEEDLWEEVEPNNLVTTGIEAEGTGPRPSIGRKSPLRDLGRLGGRGRRRYWGIRREKQLRKSLKSNVGHWGDSHDNDSNQGKLD